MSQEGVPSGGLIPQAGDPVPTPRTPSGEPLRASRRGGSRPPTYQGSGLPLDDRYPTRDDSWAAMSAKIRGRLAELAGDVIEWFAWQDPYSSENRPRAVVLGTRALCIAEPRIDSRDARVYELNRYEFVPGSHKTIPVEHRPGRGGGAGNEGRTPVAARRCRSPRVSSGCRRRKRGSSGTFPRMPKSSCKHLLAPKTPYDAASTGTRATLTASTYTCSS